MKKFILSLLFFYSAILLAQDIVIYGAQHAGTGPLDSAYFEGHSVRVPTTMYIKSIEGDAPSFCLNNISNSYQLCMKTSQKDRYIGKSIPPGVYKLFPDLPYFEGIANYIARMTVVVSDDTINSANNNYNNNYNNNNANNNHSSNYLGCYRDKGDPWGTRGRDLNGEFISREDMSIEKCISLCSSYGYRYAGLQYSKQCFCGNSYGKYGRANNCNMRCSGNYNQTCGGVWANSVYRVSKKYKPLIPTTTYEIDTDRMGMDYTSFNLPRANAHLCQKACMKDRRCKAWTYVKPYTIQGSNPRCWLKYGVPKPLKRSCCISGVKKK